MYADIDSATYLAVGHIIDGSGHHPLWMWGLDQQQAFQASRDIFTSDKFLAHFDRSVPLTLSCNTSGCGVGALKNHTPSI